MRIIEPGPGASFNIGQEPTWPSIVFRTDASTSHRWEWKISWRNFEKSGSVTTPSGSWDAAPLIADCGGTLSVRVTAGSAMAATTVQVRGTNPSALSVKQYLATKLSSAGMEEIMSRSADSSRLKANHCGPSTTATACVSSPTRRPTLSKSGTGSST